MRKYNFILMAFVLLLGMAQCKKEPATPNVDNNGGVKITLKVDDPSTDPGTANGEKLNVYPATGAVIFTQNDEIYVGNNGKYVGTLTFDNGLFQGTIDDELCSNNDYLHFYFVGNKPTTPSTLAAGTTTYTVNISDQSAGLPAISYAPSTAKYSPITMAYTAKLLNKSALVKFVPSLATSQPITVSGLNNEVQIDFANHTLASTGTTGGITLFSAGESEKWAILLEQASLSGLTVTVDGYNATIDGTTLPNNGITNNMYYNSGVGIAMIAAYQTFVVTSSSPETTIAAFNAAASTPTPTLHFNTDYEFGLNITRANGIVDFNGHSAKELFIQNDVEGESITFQNGTITPNPIDGSNQGFYYKGTVILENMTVNGLIYTDGHAYIINSGTYNQKICCDTYSDCPGTTTIYGGYFTELGFNTTTHGTYILYGGKYKTRPDDSWCATGYSVKTNTDSDSGTYPWVVSALPAGAINGEFTINGNGDKVYFSKGNLQYKDGTGWRFAEHQYDYISTWNTSDWVNHFGWATWGSGKNPLHTNMNPADYQWSTDFQGTLDGHNDWYTLSTTEWQYLFNSRDNASSLFGSATVNSVHGIVVLPDNWTLPSGSSFNPGMNGWNNNTYDASAWASMEAAGAVFLPAVGRRSGTDVNDFGEYGGYWSSTDGGEFYAWNAHFYYNCVYPGFNDVKDYGQSVRLVRDVQ